MTDRELKKISGVGNIDFLDLQPKDIQYHLANLNQVTFEVTDSCNLRCTYCAYGEFYENYDNRENKMFPIEKAIRLLDYLANLWNSNRNTSYNKNVYIGFYGGEPLLNMPFIETIVDYVQKKLHCPHRHFSFAITTNAVLLDRHVDFLVQNNFSTLISLDGNAANNSHRIDKAGKSSFEKIIRNIDLLQEKHPDYFENKVHFNAVLHNKNSVEAIYCFFKNKYDKIPGISALNDNGIKPEKRNLFTHTYRNVEESLYESKQCKEIEKDMFIQTGSYQNFTTFLHQYSGFVFRDYNELLYEQKRIKTLSTGTCIPFSKKMFVTVNGKILPCERIGQHHALGEITEKEIIIDFDAIARKYNSYYKKLNRQCAKCYRVKSCLQCIFNLNDIETTCKCYSAMNKTQFKQYVEHLIDFIAKHPEDYYRIIHEVIIT